MFLCNSAFEQGNLRLHINAFIIILLLLFMLEKSKFMRLLMSTCSYIKLHETPFPVPDVVHCVLHTVWVLPGSLESWRSSGGVALQVTQTGCSVSTTVLGPPTNYV